MPAVLITQEALDRQRVPLIAPVMFRAVWPILADETYRATGTPVVVPAARAILA